MKRQHRLCKSLTETDLKLHITIILVRLLVQSRTDSEVIVLIDAEEWATVVIFDDTIHIEILTTLAYMGDLRNRGERQRKKCRYDDGS